MDYFYIFKSPVGYIEIGVSNQSVVLIKKVHERPENFGTKTDLISLVCLQLEEYFAGKRKEFDFPYTLKGTDFQIRVWKALCDIPYGKTCTYKDVAQAIGNEKACRAVGNANGKNPISLVVP